MYSRPDDTLAIVKQLVPPLPSTGKIGELLSSRAPAETAYVGNYNGHMFAMSTRNFPLVQLAEAYGSHTNTPLLDAGPSYKNIDEESDDYDNSDPYSKKKTYKRPNSDDHLYDPQPDTVCRIDSPEFLSCMRGLHGIQRFEKSLPPTGQIGSSDSNLENYSGSYQPALTPEIDDKYTSSVEEITGSGVWHDGIGKFWKTYLLIIATFCYFKRKHLQDYFSRHGEPLVKEYILPHVERYVDSYRQRRYEDVDNDSNKSDKKAKNKVNRNRKKDRDASSSPGPDSQANSTAIDIHLPRAEDNERTVTFAQGTKLEGENRHTAVNFSNGTMAFSEGQYNDSRYLMPPMVSSALTVTDTILGEHCYHWEYSKGSAHI